MIRWADARGGADAGGRHLRGITQQKYDTVKELHSKSMVYSTPVVGERRGRPRGRRAAAGGAKRVGGRGGGWGVGWGGWTGGGTLHKSAIDANWSTQTGQYKLVITNWSTQTGQRLRAPSRESRSRGSRPHSIARRFNAIRAIKCDPSN